MKCRFPFRCETREVRKSYERGIGSPVCVYRGVSRAKLEREIVGSSTRKRGLRAGRKRKPFPPVENERGIERQKGVRSRCGGDPLLDSRLSLLRATIHGSVLVQPSPRTGCYRFEIVLRLIDLNGSYYAASSRGVDVTISSRRSFLCSFLYLH